MTQGDVKVKTPFKNALVVPWYDGGGVRRAISAALFRLVDFIIIFTWSFDQLLSFTDKEGLRFRDHISRTGAHQ